MPETSELQFLINNLTVGSPSDKALTLGVLSDSPEYDTRLLPYLEALLEDQTACLLWIPYHFGEIRWLAAHVLAQTRRGLNISNPVIISGIARPLSANELTGLQKQAQVSTHKNGLIERYLDVFEQLKAMNKLPLLDIEVYGLPDKPNVYRPHQP